MAAATAVVAALDAAGYSRILVETVGVGQDEVAVATLAHYAGAVATGVEDPFLTAYREGSFHYLLIVADYVGW